MVLMKDFFLFIRNQAELLQYVIFFGLMAAFVFLKIYKRSQLTRSLLWLLYH